jgi:hypothetical protein
MTAADFGNKQVVFNQLNSMIFGEDPVTAAYVPGCKRECQKNSSRNFMSEKQIGKWDI